MSDATVASLQAPGDAVEETKVQVAEVIQQASK